MQLVRGDRPQAATEIMNRHGAVEIEKISARQELPRADQGEELPVHDPSVQTGRFRSPGSGVSGGKGEYKGRCVKPRLRSCGWTVLSVSC